MRFVPYFGVRVRHDYYPGALCRDLRIEPTARTRRLLDGYRLRLRELPDGFAVLAPLDAEGKGALIAVKRDEVFDFELRARNADFVLFTDLREVSGKTDPVYTNAGLSAKDAGVLKLAERKPPAAPDSTRLAALELRCDKTIPAPDGGDGAQFELRFKARAVRWAYYLVTDRSGEFSIVDSGTPALAFSASNRTLLNKNPDENDTVAAALARQYPDLQRLRFLSDQPVPCSSAARKSIDLRLGSRKAVETLPNPSIQRLSRVKQKAALEDTLHQVVKYLKTS
jgi:hypothetical protein